MSELMKDRTSVIVANRISTIKDYDVIIVIDDRRIIEQGSHEELLSIKEFYYEMYQSQMKKDNNVLFT